MLFYNKTFYLFECISQPGFTMTSGRARNRNGTLDMTKEAYSSSENWQLYWQQDRYFIRNFDYDSSFQLGLTEDSLDKPRLYERNGLLGQQWDIVEVGGGYKLSNGLLGNESWLALPDGTSTPTMQKEGSGLVWNITRNRSADSDPNVPNGLSMYSEVEGFEVPQESSSTSSSATLASSITTPTSSVASTGTIASPPSSSTSLAPGVIAGIVLGSIAILVGVMCGVCFITWKRKAAITRPYELHHQQSSELHENSEVYEKYVCPAELGSKQASDVAAELPGVRYH